MINFNPDLEKQYPKGALVSARAYRVLNHGVEFRLENQVEAIVRNRELSWDVDPPNVHDLVKPGQLIDLRVIGIDRERGRLELSLRQVARDPWQNIEQRYMVGQVVQKRVSRLWRRGAFIELEPAVDGFISIQEISATPPDDIGQVLWIGDLIEAVIIRVVPADRRIDLSIRERLHQLHDVRSALTTRAPASEQGASLIDLLRPADRQRLLQWRGEQTQASAPTHHAALAARFSRVLIAEDDLGFRNSLARLLRILGHQVEIVESAEKAISQISEKQFDLILMDMGFVVGALNGLEATRKIVARYPELPVVIVTGIEWLERNEELIAQARVCGARSALLKPLELERLQRVLRLIAEGKDAWHAAEIPANLEHAQIGLLKHSPIRARGEDDLAMLALPKLDALLHLTGATACVLFRMDPVSRFTQVITNVGAPLNPTELAKHTLQASPIDEVIRQKQSVVEPDVARHPLRFRHLRLLDFSACLGVPVESAKRTEFGLFLFHSHKEHFTPQHLEQAHAAANLLGAQIMQAQAAHIIQQMQPHIFIGQLGSTLVHELNNRLGSVLNDAETLSANYARLTHDPSVALDPKWRDDLGGSIAHIKDKGKSISDIARLYLGLISTEKYEPVNLNQVIQRAIRFVEHYAESSQVRITLDLANDLPPTMSIAVRLEQALVNVILNAIQQTFLTKGGGDVEIQTRFYDGALPIQIRIRDTGPGIHLQNQERIFDLGFSTRPDGTGIGLFVTKNMLESLGGQIRIEESIILIGTSFLIELPVRVPAE